MKLTLVIRFALITLLVQAPSLSQAQNSDIPYAGPEDGGPRLWEVTGVSNLLNLRGAPSTSAEVVGVYEPGDILNNLGCQDAEGRTWCDVQALEGGARGYVAAEFLTPAVGPDGTVATGWDDSASRAGQRDFDATGLVPCTMAEGQERGQCEFGVARSGGGFATLVIKRPDGGSRIVFFAHGRAISASTSEADPGDFSATREGDMNLIQIGDELYEIPDAAVLGG